MTYNCFHQIIYHPDYSRYTKTTTFYCPCLIILIPFFLTFLLLLPSFIKASINSSPSSPPSSAPIFFQVLHYCSITNREGSFIPSFAPIEAFTHVDIHHRPTSICYQLLYSTTRMSIFIFSQRCTSDSIEFIYLLSQGSQYTDKSIAMMTDCSANESIHRINRLHLELFYIFHQPFCMLPHTFLYSGVPEQGGCCTRYAYHHSVRTSTTTSTYVDLVP